MPFGQRWARIANFFSGPRLWLWIPGQSQAPPDHLKLICRSLESSPTTVISAQVRVGGGFSCRDCRRLAPALLSLKRYVFRGLWRVPPTASHLERFCAKSMLPLRWGTHVFSRPLVFSTESALGALESKSLQVYSRFCVHLSKTTVKAE